MRIIALKVSAVFRHYEKVSHLKAILGYNYQNGELAEEVGTKVFRNLCAEVRIVVKGRRASRKSRWSLG